MIYALAAYVLAGLIWAAYLTALSGRAGRARKDREGRP